MSELIHCPPVLTTLKDSLPSDDLTDTDEVYIYRLRLLGCIYNFPEQNGDDEKK